MSSFLLKKENKKFSDMEVERIVDRNFDITTFSHLDVHHYNDSIESLL